MSIVEIDRCQSNLPQIVEAVGSPRRFANTLHRGQQHRDQDPNDRNHDQEFNKREAASVFWFSSHGGSVAAQWSCSSMSNIHLKSMTHAQGVAKKYGWLHAKKRLWEANAARYALHLQWISPPVHQQRIPLPAAIALPLPVSLFKKLTGERSQFPT